MMSDELCDDTMPQPAGELDDVTEQISNEIKQDYEANPGEWEPEPLVEITSLDEILRQEKSYRLCYHLSGYLSKLIEQNGYESLTMPQRYFYIVHHMDCMINNGGFSSYFANFTGDHANEILAALEEIGAQEEHEMMAEAIAIFPNGFVPPDRAERSQAIDAIPEERWREWNRMSVAYYNHDHNLVPEDALDQVLADYVLENRAAFE